MRCECADCQGTVLYRTWRLLGYTLSLIMYHSTQDSLRTLKPGTGLQLRPNKLLRLLSNNL